MKYWIKAVTTKSKRHALSAKKKVSIWVMYTVVAKSHNQLDLKFKLR